MSIRVVTFSMAQFGQKYQNVVRFENPDGTMTDALLATELQNNWIPAIKNLQSNTLIWTSISIRKQINAGEAPYQVALNNISGLHSFANVHPCVAYLWSFKTAFSLRSARGRMYIPGVHSSYYNTGLGQLSPAGVTENNAKAAIILARYGADNTSGSGVYLCVGGQAPESIVRRVREITVRNNLGIQRRRNIGMGV